MTQSAHSPSGNQLRFALNLRWVAVASLLIIVVMLIIWKPWAGGANADDRTITVRGEATLTAKPDEFVFYPMYEFKATDKNTALAELSKKSDEVVNKLKELGVPEGKIKTDSNAYGRSYAPSAPESVDSTFTLSLSVTVSDQNLVQKVQDYLVSTGPTGSISPQASFSDSKRKQLEGEARVKAVEDAKTKADQTAKELGFKTGKVKSVSDGTELIGPVERDATSAPGKVSLGVHPGENELPYSVSVVFFID